MEDKGKGRLLQELEEEAGISVQTFANAPDTDLARLHEFALEVEDALPRADEVVLNLTGGNKLMALGFLEMLRDTVHRRIYTDTAHGRLEQLPVGHEPAEPPFRSRRYWTSPSACAPRVSAIAAHSPPTATGRSGPRRASRSPRGWRRPHLTTATSWAH